MCHAYKKKREKTEEIKLPNQEKIKMLREKETYKYLGILEVDTIKFVEIKEIKKSISDERENFWKPSSAAAGISSKG